MAVGDQGVILRYDPAADVIPPLASVAGPTAWCRSAVFAFSGSDGPEGSGIARYEYRLDGGSWRAGETVALGDDRADGRRGLASGEHLLECRVLDGAGNWSAPARAVARLDGLAPLTTDDAPSGPQRQSVTVHLTAEDAHSGVAVTWYSLDGGPWTPGTSVTVPARKSGSDDGWHAIRYYSVDAAGNFEPVRSCAVLIAVKSGWPAAH